SRLVDRLADEIGGKALLELLLPRERMVELCEGHRARVVPGVDHLLDAAHLATAGLAVEHDVIDERPVQVIGHFASPRFEIGDRAGAEALLAVRALAPPYGQGRAPIALAGERPIDIALQPLAEAAVLDVLRVPA